MKKALMLIGSYFLGTVAGGLLGVAVWPEPSHLVDLPGFLIMAPLFQLMSTLRGPNPNAIGQPVFQSIFGIILLLVFLVMIVASAAWFWKTGSKWFLLVFAIPAFMSSLPGTSIVAEAISW